MNQTGLIVCAMAIGTSAMAASSAQDRIIRFEDLVTIRVAEEPNYTIAHTITIRAEPPIAARSTAELENRVWTATRQSERGTEVIRSTECPALQRLALSFGQLPAIPIRPMVSEVVDPTAGLPPTRKDGFSTRLAFSTRTVDGSSASVELAGGNAYADWGHDAVSALLPCWGPLWPAGKGPKPQG